MTFGEKLKKLRTDRKLTQEELAEKIFVTRTAVSKWESGKGYPSIDSLKAIAEFFGITIDNLLSSEEILTLAEEDNNQRKNHIFDLVFGLIDTSVFILLFLPFFGQESGGIVQGTSLLSFTKITPHLRVLFFVFVIGIVIYGILTLTMQNAQHKFWIKNKRNLSLLLTASAVILFVITKQPYAALFLFFLCAIKGIILIHWK